MGLPPQFLVEHQADPYGDQGSAGRGQAHGQQGSGKGLAGSVDQRDPGQDNGNHIMEKENSERPQAQKNPLKLKWIPAKRVSTI